MLPNAPTPMVPNTAPGSGGGGTPGGTNTQVQYNNGGSFGGITNLTSNGTNAFLTAITAPATPAAGFGVIYEDSTNKVLALKNDAGTVSSTVVPSSAGANQFATAISAAGVISYTQPTFSNISGTATAAQLQALTASGVGHQAGIAPDPGGVAGTTHFLREDATWAVPAGGSPASPSGSIQYNNSGAFGAFGLWDGSAVVSIGNSTTAQALRVYNTVDTLSGPTNYERGVFDFTTTANVLTVGTQKGGTGTARQLVLLSAAANNIIGVGSATSSQPAIRDDGGGALGIVRADNSAYTQINSGSVSASGSVTATGNFYLNNNTGLIQVGAAADPSLARAASNVLEINNGTKGTLTGTFFQWGGQARVTSDVTFTSTAVLATVTGLSVNVSAGRTYKFTAELSWTDAAAGGIQAAIAGTCTATNIIYDGWIIDSGANGIKGNAQATALGGAVASATTTGTAGHLTIEGTITVNAAGTLLVQAAQNTSNATATTIKRGSTFYVYDMQ